MKMPTLEQFRTNRNVLFWSLHAAGWAAYGITQYFGALLYEKPSSYARVIAVAAVSGFLLSMPMRFIYRRLWGRPPRLMITGVLATCYITALALRIVINLSYKQFVEPDWHAQTLFELFGGALSTTYLLLCWSVLYFGIKFYESQRKQERALLKAVALAQEAQLKMLRYQLNPHFLFNTLNAISTLILDNQNRKANHAVTRLSEFLRYTLDQDPMKKVTLRQEIEALDLYLGTERLRFGERLRLEYAIEEAALNALVPSLLLQPLLENSLKYAVSAREQGGLVRIEGRVREGLLELPLRNGADSEIVAQCATGRGPLAAIQQYKPDLVFLDIQMPGMWGFEVRAPLPQESLPVVVFVTAYDQYAIQAFEARAVDYLLKPIDDTRFAATLTRVREHARARSAADQRDRLLQIIAEITGCGELALDELLERGRKAIDGRRPEVLPIRQGRETVRVPVVSIEWIDAAGDYMCIHAAGDTHILRGTMKELEEILDPKLFQRVHRSTIVNLRLVRSLRAHMNGEYFLTLEGGHELKLSRTYRGKIEYFLSGSASSDSPRPKASRGVDSLKTLCRPRHPGWR